jgi:hypothetical protein
MLQGKLVLPMDSLPQEKINNMAEVLSLLALLRLYSHKSTNPGFVLRSV